MRLVQPNSLDRVLDDYPGMSIVSDSGSGICLCGKLRFQARMHDGEEIEDWYRLKIEVQDQFPRALPRVEEIGGRIPRDGNFHVNPDGSLCLGSPFRLLRKIYNSPTLSGFIDKCLIPYLYAISCKLKNGGDFVFGELAHGDQGVIDDYLDMFGLLGRSQIIDSTKLLAVKKRLANKKLCPCGCGKRLGACSFHLKLNEFRKMASVSWFKAHILE